MVRLGTKNKDLRQIKASRTLGVSPESGITILRVRVVNHGVSCVFRSLACMSCVAGVALVVLSGLRSGCKAVVNRAESACKQGIFAQSFEFTARLRVVGLCPAYFELGETKSFTRDALP